MTAGETPPSRHGRTIFRGTSWQMLAQFAPLVVNLLLTPFVITHLGRMAYGLWLVSQTLTAFFAQFDGGITRTALRYFALLAGEGDRRRTASYLGTLLLVILAITAVTLVPIFIFSGAIVDFFHAPPELRPGVDFLLKVMVVLVGVGFSRNMFVAILNARQRFGLSSVTILLGYAVYAVGMYYAVSRGYGLRGVAIVQAVQHAVATLIVVPSALRYVDLRGFRLLPWRDLKDFLKFAVKVQLAGALNLMSYEGSMLIVARLAPGQVADFGPGATFALQLKQLPMNAEAPAQTLMANQLGESGHDRTVGTFHKLQRMWVILIVGLAATGAPAVYHGINSWLPLGSQLAGQVGATLLLAHMYGLLVQLLQQWNMLLGHPEIEMWNGIVTVTTGLVLAVLLARGMGGWGVAVAMLIGQILGNAAALVLTRRKLEVRPRSPLAEIPLVAAGIGAGLSAALSWGAHLLVQRGFVPHGPLGLLVCGAAGGAALAVYGLISLGPEKLSALRRGRALGLH